MKTNKTSPEDYKLYFQNEKYNLEFVEEGATIFTSVGAPKVPNHIINEVLKYIREESSICVFNPYYSRTTDGIVFLDERKNKVKLYKVELDYKNNNHEYIIYDDITPVPYKYEYITPLEKICSFLFQRYDLIKGRKVTLNYKEIYSVFSNVADAINNLLCTDKILETGYYQNESLGKVFFAAFCNMIYDFLYNHIDVKRLFKALITKKVKCSMHTYSFDVSISVKYVDDYDGYYDYDEDTLVYTSPDSPTVKVTFVFDYSKSILYIYPYFSIDYRLSDIDFPNVPFKGNFDFGMFAEPRALPIYPLVSSNKLEIFIPSS